RGKLGSPAFAVGLDERRRSLAQEPALPAGQLARLGKGNVSANDLGAGQVPWRDGLGAGQPPGVIARVVQHGGQQVGGPGSFPSGTPPPAAPPLSGTHTRRAASPARRPAAGCSSGTPAARPR